MNRTILLALAVLVIPPAAHAQKYKCIYRDGTSSLQDVPCDGTPAPGAKLLPNAEQKRRIAAGCEPDDSYPRVGMTEAQVDTCTWFDPKRTDRREYVTGSGTIVTRTYKIGDKYIIMRFGYDGRMTEISQ